MLRIVQCGNSLPASFICDPSAEFQPGQCAELTVVGNQVMCTVSDGTAPIGIIDDIRTNAFTNISWNEVIMVPATAVPGSNPPVSAIDIKAELRKPNIVAGSFVSTVDVLLNPINGIITFVAGTLLNFDMVGSGTPNAIKTIVNYTYQVSNIPGDDSTLGSQRITVWFQRMFFQTDCYESNQMYPVRANLYVSEHGFLTTRRPSDRHPAVAMVTAPPSSQNVMIEALWL
jgi:hypothetical protein